VSRQLALQSLKQAGPWTCGALAKHIESFAGDSARAYLSATFLQPFLSYITASKTTIAINTESTYDRENERWSIPVNVTVNQLLRMGKQIVQVGGGLRYWVDSRAAGPDGWGFRLQLTLLYPRQGLRAVRARRGGRNSLKNLPNQHFWPVWRANP